MDNAIEACSKLEEEKRKILDSIKKTGTGFGVEDRKLCTEKYDTIRSTKHDGRPHGIGMESVKKAVVKISRAYADEMGRGNVSGDNYFISIAFEEYKGCPSLQTAIGGHFVVVRDQCNKKGELSVTMNMSYDSGIPKI